MKEEQSEVYERLMAAGIRFVSFRPRSEKEILDFLHKKLSKSHTTAPKVLDQVIIRLRELGYVDDEKFAAWWVDQRTGRKPKGKRVIEQELKQKGIEADIRIDEKTLAVRAIQKKLPVWKIMPLLKRKKKISEYLYRRGFDWNVIGRVVDEVLEIE